MIDRRLALMSLATAAVATPALSHPHDELNDERRADIEKQILAFRNDLKTAVAADRKSVV